MNKLIYILLIFLTISVRLYSQSNSKEKTDTYGAYPWSYGQPSADTSSQGMVGMLYPKTAYAERLLRLRKKLNYTDKERQVLVKYYAGKELTPQENMILRRALRKKEKRQRLEFQYTLDTLRHNARINPELSEFEKQLLDKESDTTQRLTLADKKALQIIHRHQRNLERIKRRQTLTPQDSALILMAKSDSTKLSLINKIKLIAIRQKEKRIQNIKLQRMANQGYSTPVRAKGMKAIVEKINFFDPHKRPSSYIRKAHNLARRYALTDNEKKAYNKMIGGYTMFSLKDKYLAYRAYNKLQKYKRKKYKLDQKYFWSLQEKQVKQRHRHDIRRDKQSYDKRIIIRMLRNIEQTLKHLLS